MSPEIYLHILLAILSPRFLFKIVILSTAFISILSDIVDMRCTKLYYLLLVFLSTLACQNTESERLSHGDPGAAEGVRKGPALTLQHNKPYKDILSDENKSNWSGSQNHWHWENGTLTGETTEDNPIGQNSFLVWNREVEDFVLNISFRISSHGNSGIYYRCEIGPEGYDRLLGYQADIDGQHNYTGIVYENYLDRHHKILAPRGEFVRISKKDRLQSFPIYKENYSAGDLIKDGSWNDYELIVKDNSIIQKLNGRIISMVEDHFPDRLEKGKFGFQLHKGPPMKVEFRNARFIDLNNR